MGILNLLKASYVGKVGQTVGAKWKNLSTIRVFTKPAYTNTPAQQTVRAGFGDVSSFSALFTDQLRSLSALSVKGMSVRNAIIRLNADMVNAGTLTESALQISRGGLPRPTGFTATAPAGLASINATWTPITGVSISDKARVVVVVVSQTANFALVGSALNSAGTLSLPGSIPASTQLHVYAYLIDYRGSSRVGSRNIYQAVMSPAS